MARAELATGRHLLIEAALPSRRYVQVAHELVDLYAPRVGLPAVGAWLALRVAADRGEALPDGDPVAFVARVLAIPPLQAASALRALGLFGLVEELPHKGLRVNEPLPEEEFRRRFADPAVTPADRGAVGSPDAASPDAASPETAAPAAVATPDAAPHEGVPEVAGQQETGATEAAASADEAPDRGKPAEGGSVQAAELPGDIKSVLEWYHQRIGLISETQLERLCEWITERRMTPDVVALAIEQTARSAEYASFNYLEGVLRNWFNQGVRTWDDVLRRPHLVPLPRQGGPAQAPSQAGPSGGGAPSSGPAPAEPRDRPMSGVPNAAAYQPVDPERVKRWKEMYRRGR